MSGEKSLHSFVRKYILQIFLLWLQEAGSIWRMLPLPLVHASGTIMLIFDMLQVHEFYGLVAMPMLRMAYNGSLLPLLTMGLYILARPYGTVHE